MGPRSETSANNEAKPDAKKGPEEVALERDIVPEEKTEAKIEPGTSSQ
jgi:hypothetical protein